MTELGAQNEKAPRVVRATGFIMEQAGKFTPAEALSALTMLVQVARESVQIHQEESTKREKIRAYRETEVERIKASEAVLRDYFDRVFQERSETHRRLFETLDQAVASGDVAAIQAVVGGIVEIARTSPLANIGDLGELRRAMDDPDAIFDL